MTALLPCPFCGGKGCQHRFLRSFVTIECANCYAEIPGHSKQEAIAAWNRRVTPAEVEALRAERDRLVTELYDLRCLAECEPDHDGPDVWQQNAALRARVEALEGVLRVAIEALEEAGWVHTADKLRAALGDTP